MIYLVWAPPSEGKTLWATYEAIRLMKLGRRVFSNYPIVYTEKKGLPFRRKAITYSSYIWKKEFMYNGLHDCSIIIDEAYHDYSARRRDVGVDEHSFFATNGHDGNDIYLIAQHYIRLDTIIREMASFFVFVRKFNNPFSRIGSGGREGELKPLFFTYEMYISEEDFKFRHIDKNAVWKKGRVWFNKKKAESYDTKFFRHEETPTEYSTWDDYRGMIIEEDREVKQAIDLLS